MASMTDFLQTDLIQESAVPTEPEKTDEELAMTIVESYLTMSAAFANVEKAFECASICAFCEAAEIEKPDNATVVVETFWDSVKNVFESTFPYIYAAPLDAAYAESTIRIVDRNGDPHTTKIPFAKGASLVTRTRTIVDEEGKIKAANYGCIRRFEVGPSRRGVALLRLSYVFNPTPNDTNLESK